MVEINVNRPELRRKTSKCPLIFVNSLVHSKKHVPWIVCKAVSTHRSCVTI